MAVLTIQSSVARGFVGNAAAVFCLRRSGIDAWPVDTVAFSHHPGHGRPGGGARTAADIADIIAGLDRQGALARCDAVLSGYLGTAATADVVAETVELVRARNPRCVFLCDPVMGDREPGLYVEAPIRRAIAERLVPAADAITPNQFELEHLTGTQPTSTGDAVDAARTLLGERLRLCIVTSLMTDDLADGRISTLAVTADAAWRAITPCLALRARGAGDVFAALFLAHWLQGASIQAALSAAVSSLYAVIDATAAVDADELCVVDAQTAIERPPNIFDADRIC